jgi:hypothetical protein
VTVKGDGRPVTDPLGDRFDDGCLVLDLEGAEPPIRAVDLGTGRHVEVEIEGVVTELVDDPFGLVRVRGRLGLVAGVAVTVDPDRVAVLSAQELVRRNLEGPPDEVVERDIDPGDRGQDGARDQPLARHLLDEVLVEAVEIARVLADEEGRHPLDDLWDPGATVSLASPDEAGFGVDPDQRPRVVPVDGGGLDVRYLEVPGPAAAVGELIVSAERSRIVYSAFGSCNWR